MAAARTIPVRKKELEMRTRMRTMMTDSSKSGVEDLARKMGEESKRRLAHGSEHRPNAKRERIGCPSALGGRAIFHIGTGTRCSEMAVRRQRPKI